MTLDINTQVFEEGDYLEDEAIRYRDELMGRFFASPEGQEVIGRKGGMRGWPDTFMEYAIGYLGLTPPQMSAGDVEEVLFDIFPRKVSAQPGAGEEIVEEL